MKRKRAMKRLHIHMGVQNLDDSIRFYSALFGAEPAKVKDDYAKWMLDDPHVNFAISTGEKTGVDHLGIQTDNAAELTAVRAQIEAADLASFNEGETVCCYAQSDKTWVEDPAGVAWEAYHTMGDAEKFHGEVQRDETPDVAEKQSAQTEAPSAVPVGVGCGCC